MFWDFTLIRWLIREAGHYPELKGPKTGRRRVFLSISGTS